MNHQEAFVILQDVFSTPVENTYRSTPQTAVLLVRPTTRTGVGSVVLFVLLPGKSAEGRTITAFDHELMEVCKEQEFVRVLPIRDEESIDADRYRTFAEGARLALGACDLASVNPSDLFLSDLLRVPALRTAEELAEAILDRGTQRRVLPAIEMDDIGVARDFPRIEDVETQRDLWTLLHDSSSFEEKERAARAMVDGDRREAIPYLLHILDGWYARMSGAGGLYWISDDGRNLDVVLARILEPLLRKATSSRDRDELEALEFTEMFDEEKETTLIPWIYDD